MMREKIRIYEAVIVEGRYDKIKLSNIIDALFWRRTVSRFLRIRKNSPL